MNDINYENHLTIIHIPYLFLVDAQYYTSGADPASVKWRRIETENFDVIFSKEYEEKGQYIAKILEEVYKYAGRSLKHSPKKISVLVHTESAYSNGFVTWAPKRIEMYNSPNQDNYAQDWLQQLALHEFRHVVQLDKLNDGFTKMLSYILGEQAVGAVLGMFVPMWFLEGDAVTNETALTQSGRGRSPEFEQGMRAQIMDKEIYPYEKAMFGSYKDYVPNHYEMGYQLVAGARARYGADIWERALYNTGRNPLNITPFSQGQKKVSGLNKVKLYESTFSDLWNKWKKQDDKYSKINFRAISKLSEEYLNYKFVQVLGDSGFIAERSGPGEIDQFVWIDMQGDEEVLFTPGSRYDEPFSFANHTLCWAELEPDPRWENRMFSVIKTYDIKTKESRKVTAKSRYFSPALSPEGTTIATVGADNQNNYRLVLLDALTGEAIKEFEHNKNNYLFTPSWNRKGNKIVCIALSDKGKEISVLDVGKESWAQITKPTFMQISLPKWGSNDEILFTAGYSGTDEIYAVKDRTINQLTQSKYGARGAVVSGEGLVYSRYTADGYQLVKSDAKDLLHKPLGQVENHAIKLYETIAGQEIAKPDFSSVDTVPDYDVKKYSKWNLFKVHSWAPAFINVKDESVDVGATVMSQSLLGTTSTSFGYNGDSQKSLEKYYFNFKYEGWYPVFELEVKHGDDKIKYNANDVYVSSVDTFSYRANERRVQTQVELDASLPINLTRGKFYSYLQPSVEYGMVQRSGYDVDVTTYTVDRLNRLEEKDKSVIEIPKVDYQTLEYSLYFHHLLKTSERDVTYRFGGSCEILYQNTPWGNIDAGGILGLYSRLFFPGFMKHHSIRVENSYQYKTMGDSWESDDRVMYRKQGDYFSFPRGYATYDNDRLYSLKADYVFPLCNPDLNLPGVFYLKRLTTNLFYDYSWAQETREYVDGTKNDISNNFSSAGFEVRGEVHAFRFMFPLSVGYRYARLLDLKQNKHEFLMGINISGYSIGK